MNKSAKNLLVSEALQIFATGSLIIITSMVSLQTYVSYQKLVSTKKLFLDEVLRNSDQIFLFSKLNKVDSLNNILFEITNNFKDIDFCIKNFDTPVATSYSCESNATNYNSTSFGPDNSITIFYKISPFSNLSNNLFSTLMLSLLYLLLFSFFIFKLNSKLALVFVNSLSDIVQRVNSIGHGDRSIFKTNQQVIEINQIETELNKLVHKLSDLETKIESKISKKYALQVAHDIRSPVGALKMLFSIIEVNHESKEFAQLCLERINNIANDLLNTQKNTSELEIFKPSSLESMIRNIENEFLLRFNLNKRFIVFNSNSQITDITSIFAISSQSLSRVFAILVQNTFDEFTEPQRIKILFNITVDNPTSITFSYSDNGPGFNQKVLECLKNNKSYVTSKKSEYSGHGMGLAYFIKAINRYGRIITIGNNNNSPGVKIHFSLNLVSNELTSHFTTTPEEPLCQPNLSIASQLNPLTANPTTSLN